MKDLLLWIAIVGFGIFIYSIVAAANNGGSDDADNYGCLGICIVIGVIIIAIIAASV